MPGLLAAFVSAELVCGEEPKLMLLSVAKVMEAALTVLELVGEPVIEIMGICAILDAPAEFEFELERERVEEEVWAGWTETEGR